MEEKHTGGWAWWPGITEPYYDQTPIHVQHEPMDYELKGAPKFYQRDKSINGLPAKRGKGKNKYFKR